MSRNDSSYSVSENTMIKLPAKLVWGLFIGASALGGGIAVAQLQIRNLDSDVADLRKAKNEQAVINATSQKDIEYIKKGLDDLNSKADRLLRQRGLQPSRYEEDK